MYKVLPILSIIFALFFFNFNATAYASTTTTHKHYHAYWQLLTLKQVLTVQANSTVITTHPDNTVSPTATPTPTVTALKKTTPTQITSPTHALVSGAPTPTKILTVTTAPAEAAAVNDVTSYIMNEINKYRATQGLAPVVTSAETCSFAKIRAHEINSSFSHDGFNSRVSSHTLPYVHWTSVTENIAMTSDYKQVETMWQNSPGHAENMRANTPFVCVIQDGDYFAYEGMKP